MTTPPKAKKKPRNQPIQFDETLTAAPFETALANGVSRSRRFTRRQAKIILTIIWISAAICVGIGFGRLISAS